MSSSQYTQILSAPLIQKYSNPFLRKVTEAFHHALVYKKVLLLKKAREKIPVHDLEETAARKMREMQRQSRKDTPTDPPVSMLMLVLVELLRWFKEDFFTWVDTLDCERCGSKTDYAHTLTTDRKEMYTGRIEVHRCRTCGVSTHFPRYDDPNILLETRKGRCGEWANCFTLMCCAMGWDARLIHDETDHVWTEVFCPVQARWIHCDPCDNVCDKPLMYEHGWKKSLTYIMAYSPYELQDVTWRYSSNHKEVLRRRRKCPEGELVRAIVELRNDRLRTLSENKRKYILRRTVGELAELMSERKPTSDDMVGRTSGSLDWRVARGETNETKFTSTVFSLCATQLAGSQYRIRYSCALDLYQTEGKGAVTIERWYKGIYNMSNMMRKEEKDWKQVYLCRKQSTAEGRIAWKINLENTAKVISSVTLKFHTKTFENGRAVVEILDDREHKLQLPPENELTTVMFKGAKNLIVEARLSGGNGEHAWQHAQLFRQPIDSTDPTFDLLMTFEEAS